MVKCELCPDKSNIRQNDATKCTSCNKYYHKSCSKRAKPRDDGSFAHCCPRTNRKSSVNKSSTSSINDSIIDDTASKLDPQSRNLWTLISRKFENLEDNLTDINNNLEDLTIRLDNFEDRLESLEKGTTSEDIYSEMHQRITREKNFVIFQLQDSPDAANTDLKFVVDSFNNSSLQLPFNVNTLRVTRRGRYTSGKNRILVVMMPSSTDVHWVYHNKAKIFDDSLSIRSDLTKKQLQYYKQVKEDLDKRIKSGESNLIIKHINGTPTIVTKFKSNHELQPKA